jgi:phosphate transport system substrate-binding protein
MNTHKIYSFFILIVLITMAAASITACGSTPAAPVATDAQGSPELSGTVAISGAFALYPMMELWTSEFNKLHPDVRFDLSAGGAGKGLADAVGGAVDIGMVSRDISPEEEAQGAYWVGVTKDAVFPTVNAENPVLAQLLKQGVKKEIFEGIYITGEITTWGQVIGDPSITDAIHVFTRSDAAGAPEVWAKYLGMKQEDLLGIGISGDPGLLEAVAQDPLGIGFNNLGYAYDNASGLPVAGTTTIPIDVNGNGQADADELLETKQEAVEAVATGKYPSPPARILNLVTKGKPTGIVQTFIEWIVTDGQQFVGEAGYVQLTQDQLDAALQKIR